METEHIYPLGYFDLQLAFAARVAAATGWPLDDVLLEYTALYKMLGIAGDFDAAQPAWKAALACAHGNAAASSLHELYLSRLDVVPKFTDERHWGCFAYEYRPVAYDKHTHAIRIHFSNEDDSNSGALSRERMPVRFAELAAMFAYIAEHEPQATTVCGGSWLYNRQAYRRLFPPAFTACPVVDEPHYQYRALWGQFLSHDWTVNEELADRFRERVAGLRAPDQVAGCFPHQVLLTSCPIADFFSFYSGGSSATQG